MVPDREATIDLFFTIKEQIVWKIHQEDQPPACSSFHCIDSMIAFKSQDSFCLVHKLIYFLIYQNPLIPTLAEFSAYSRLGDQSYLQEPGQNVE